MDTLILPAKILKIVAFHDFPLKAAWAVLMDQPMADPSSSDGKIKEEDNFQNYG